MFCLAMGLFLCSFSELLNHKLCPCNSDLSPHQWSGRWLQTGLPWGLAPSGRAGNKGKRIHHELFLLSQIGSFSDKLQWLQCSLPLHRAVTSGGMERDLGHGVKNGFRHWTHKLENASKETLTGTPTRDFS